MMDARTREYVNGRFSDYYRRMTVEEPLDAEDREWGFVFWADEESDETFKRHLSLLELGDLNDYVAREGPKQVYISSGRYDYPTEDDVSEKGWQKSDVLFEISVDHLAPNGTDATDDDADDEADDPQPYPDRLAQCKDELHTLLSRLDDFRFEDIGITFTGTGYLVQIRDDGYQRLGEGERRELLNYVTANGFDVRSPPAFAQGDDVISNDWLALYAGGWRKTFYNEFIPYLRNVADMPEEKALAELQEISGIGGSYASQIHNTLSIDMDCIESGQFGELDNDGFTTLVDHYSDQLLDDFRPVLNESRTAEIHSFVPLPGSLNGDTGFTAMQVDVDEVTEFNPTEDAIPEMFTSHDIAIDVMESGEYTLGGTSFALHSGEQSVPEYLGLYLMTRGRAVKTTE